MTAQVLLVDDDRDILNMMSRLLNSDAVSVVTATGGRDALKVLYATDIQLVVLDIGLPDLDGMEVLSRIREVSSVPVLMLTARGAVRDRVRGLQSGADDYLHKPFNPDELVARVHAQLRRARYDHPQQVIADTFMTVDVAQRRVRIGGDKEVTLTPTEFRLALAFARHPDQVLSHDQLIDQVWNSEIGASSDYVKTYVGYLRRKFASVQPDIDPIETVRGFGYRYRPETSARSAESVKSTTPD